MFISSIKIVRGGDSIERGGSLSLTWFPWDKFHSLASLCCSPWLARTATAAGFREAQANVLLESVQNVHGGNFFISKPKIPNGSYVVG